MNIFYIFNQATLFILMPQIALWCCLFAAAREKKCYPWPTSHVITTTGIESEQPRIEYVDAAPTESGKTITRSQAVCSELLTYLMGAAAGSAIFIWCSSNLFWPNYSSFSDLDTMIPALINMAISLSLTLPILWYRQITLFRMVTRNEVKSIIISSPFLFSVSILTVGIMLTLPFVQLIGISLGVSAESGRVMRDVFRVLIALSAIPASVACVATVSSGVLMPRRQFKAAVAFLDFDDVSALDSKADDELHHLIDVALKVGKIETAEQISVHLLRRVENKTRA